MIFIDNLAKAFPEYSQRAPSFTLLTRETISDVFSTEAESAWGTCAQLCNGGWISPDATELSLSLGDTRIINLYGKQVSVPSSMGYEDVKISGLRWLSCIETYIIASSNILHSCDTVNGKTYQEAYLQENFTYTENEGFVDPEETEVVYVEDCGNYTYSYAASHFYHYDGAWHSEPEYEELSLDDYSANPARIYGFKSEDGEITGEKTMFFGLEVELEFTDSDSCASAVEAAHNSDLVLSSDGSLDDGGEFKTPPCTYRYVRKAVSSICTIAADNGMNAESTCGIHIHVSRAALSDFCIAKVLSFMNSYHNKRFITRIAGRESDYARFYSDMNPYRLYQDTYRLRGWNGKSKAILSDNKYAAVNIMHPQTIEFRIFKSSTNEEEIMRDVQFVKTVCDFAKSLTSLSDAASLQAYLRYVSQPHIKREHPELTKYLLDSGYIQPQKRKEALCA